MGVKLKDCIVTEAEVTKQQGTISNQILEDVNVNIIGHFGNVVCLTLATPHGMITAARNNTPNLGMVIRSLVELLGLTKEDGLQMSDIKNIPIRIITESPDGLKWNSKVVGFGHYMKDQFVYTDKFCMIDEW